MKRNEYKKNKNKKGGYGNSNYIKSESVKMINPYTFVPVKKGQNGSQNRKDAEIYYGNANELQTGVLHCTLQVRTPLAIPDTENVVVENGGQKYPFYTINGQYAIPGSSIRGALRSTYEAITDSCFSTLKNDEYKVKVPGLLPCSDRKELCEGCLLFGMIASGKKHPSMGSRVRVSDAFTSKSPDNWTDNTVPLKELGGPKNSYMPFYAKYDGDKKNDMPRNYRDKNKDFEIAGRKYYWHHKNVNKNDSEYKGDKKNIRSSAMELVYPDPETEFEFDIYYDGIKEEQLQKLIWTITLGDNTAESDFCHKIGHGKPLGLGSVKIIIKENIVRIFDGNGYKFNNGITCVGSDDLKNMSGVDVNAVNAILQVANMEKPLQKGDSGLIIDYPDIYDKEGNPISINIQQNNNKVARHQWYSLNKKEQYPQKLPNIMNNEQGLKPYLYQKELDKKEK